MPECFRTILVINSNYSYLKIIDSYLKELGFNDSVLSLKPERAFQHLRERHDIKLVITDLKLPRLKDGFKFIERLRAEFTPDDLAVLGLTDVQDRVHVMDLADLGVSEILIKPINSRLLKTHLDRLFMREVKPPGFGEYLIEKGIISERELDLALEFQRKFTIGKRGVPLLGMALFLGFVHRDELTDYLVHRHVNSDSEHYDLNAFDLSLEQKGVLENLARNFEIRIGEIMMSLGLLTSHQLTQLSNEFEKKTKKERNQT